MKKIAILLTFLLCLSACGNQEIIMPQTQNNTAIDIDASRLIRVDMPGYLPVSTKSIRDILDETGRFSYQRITFPESAIANVYHHIDEDLASLFYEVLPESTTTILSYNFSKNDVRGEGHDAIKWGLDLLLRIFGTELTVEAWADIMAVAAKSETVDAWGTDYEGYVDKDTGIRLVYGNLGEKVQIDIRPYGELL